MIKLTLAAVTIVGIAVHLWGIQRDLPYIPDIDEPVLVIPAVNIAASWHLNPGWFGNPASTVIYPLAAIYHLWQAVTQGGTLLGPNAVLIERFQREAAQFYLVGRLLTAVYGALTIPLVFALGRRVFGTTVGFGGAWLAIFYPISVVHAQTVRTDAPATFFGVAALLLCARLYSRPSYTNYALAGAAVGMGIATRYFMAALLPTIVLASAPTMRARGMRRAFLGIGAAVVAAAFGFATTTPFFLDFASAMRDIQVEARSTHLGADGLTPMETYFGTSQKRFPRLSPGRSLSLRPLASS